MCFQSIKGQKKKVKAFSVLEIIIALIVISILIYTFYSSGNNIFRNLFRMDENVSRGVRLSSVGMYIKKFSENADLIFKNKELGDVIMFCNIRRNNKYDYFYFRFDNNSVYYKAKNDSGLRPDELKNFFLKTFNTNTNKIDSDISDFKLTIEDNTLKIYLKNETDEYIDYMRIFNYEKF